uniref:G-protein coupled receptors family 1 profile domain-containing protein n=1 Tax=Monopterus albus TaxID=43700 RepID=A0A3Q3JVX1_MONAL
MVLISVDRYVAICDPIVFLLHTNLEPPGRYNSCYGEVFVVAVSQARAMRSHVAAVKLQHSGTVMTKKSELKAAGTLGVVVAVFLLCYCPYYGVCQTGSNMMIGSVLESFISFLMFSNSSLNPLLYALFYPWFRKSFKNIMTLQILNINSFDKQPHTRTHALLWAIFRDTNQPKLHVFGLWEEAGVPGENPRKHGENMQTPHRKVLGGARTWNLRAVRQWR